MGRHHSKDPLTSQDMGRNQDQAMGSSPSKDPMISLDMVRKSDQVMESNHSKDHLTSQDMVRSNLSKDAMTRLGDLSSSLTSHEKKAMVIPIKKMIVGTQAGMVVTEVIAGPRDLVVVEDVAVSIQRGGATKVA